MKTAFCFDMDGTVTSTEVLPCIASELGIAEEMATLTRITMDGLIPFEESFRLRCLILGRVPLERIRAIVSEVPLDPAIISFIQTRKNNSFIVTGNLDLWILPIAEICGCKIFSSMGAIEENGLRVLKTLNKGDAIRDLKKMGYDRVVAIGDGSNDVPMFEAADIAIAYGGVHSPAPAAIGAAGFIVNNGISLCKMLNAL